MADICRYSFEQIKVEAELRMIQISIWTYLIVCPLVFIAGFIDSIAGGGGLISLPAYLIAGLPSHNAIATNKLSSSMGTSVSVFRYARLGYMPWKPAILCVAFSIAGSQGGARLSLMVDDRVLKIVMLFLLPITAIAVFNSKALATEEREPLSTVKTYTIAVLLAMLIGAYDGFYGPGTGTFLILLLTTLAHMKLTTANGVSKAINFGSNIAALTVFLVKGKALIPLGIVAGIFSIFGNYLGSRAFVKRTTGIVKPTMLVVLSVFFIKIILELFTS